jgi:V-type H+-transporting ATPase subunit C
VKYRADKPLAELIDSLQKVGVYFISSVYIDYPCADECYKELISIDNDVKSKFSQYNQIKTNLTALQRKQT